jgi:hemerythrin-like domain-containing protein
MSFLLAVAMSITALLRQQHAELLALAGRISGLLAPCFDANEVRSLVSLLVARLRVHLAIEDRVLYPQLAEHRDPAVRQLAGALAAEVGDLWARVEQYRDSWPSWPAVERRPDAFAEETRQLLERLGERIERENSELYELLEREPHSNHPLPARLSARAR